MSLKAFAGDGSSDLFNIVRAIYYAADNGANVISMSFEIARVRLLCKMPSNMPSARTWWWWRPRAMTAGRSWFFRRLITA